MSIPVWWIPIACATSLLMAGVIASLRIPLVPEKAACFKVISIILITSGVSCLVGAILSWFACCHSSCCCC